MSAPAIVPSLLSARQDLRSSWGLRSTWWDFSRQTVRSAYRRTVLGPLWITIQQLAWVFGIGILYGRLFKIDRTEMIPLVTYGFMTWGLLTSMISTAGNCFVNASSLIQSSTLPVSFHVFQTVTSTALTFAHSSVALLVVPVFFGHFPSLLGFVLGLTVLVILCINGVGFGLWLGPLAARFRDVPMAVATLLQLFLFVTPVFWSNTIVPQVPKSISLVNPFAWPIETFRDSMLGIEQDLRIWGLLVAFTVVNLAVGYRTFSRVRQSLVYWVL